MSALLGVDLVVEEAGVAKPSLFRHFGTKDDLVAAFLEREDLDFWGTWDRVADEHAETVTVRKNARFVSIRHRADVA